MEEGEVQDSKKKKKKKNKKKKGSSMSDLDGSIIMDNGALEEATEDKSTTNIQSN